MSVQTGVAAIAVVALAATGCSGEKPEDVSVDQPPATSADDTSPKSSSTDPQEVAMIGRDPSVLIRTHAPDPLDGRHASSVHGSVGVSDGGCLVLVDEGDHAWAVVLPHGSDLVDGEVTFADGESFAVGDVIDRAGMWADPALVILPEEAQRCSTDGFAFLFPPDPDDESTGH